MQQHVAYARISDARRTGLRGVPAAQSALRQDAAGLRAVYQTRPGLSLPEADPHALDEEVRSTQPIAICPRPPCPPRCILRLTFVPRRHMNELERRLKHAERLLRSSSQSATLPAAGQAPLQPPTPPSCEAGSVAHVNPPAPPSPLPAATPHHHLVHDFAQPREPVGNTPVPGLAPLGITTFHDNGPMPRPSAASRELRPAAEDEDGLEDHSQVSGDFEWDESGTPAVTTVDHWHQDHASTASSESRCIGDGMATLAVDKSQAAYFGEASGAALLKAIDPHLPASALRRKQTSFADRPRSQGSIDLHPQLSSRRLVTDALVDAYFRLYHVSYPIVHEPSFRAQYAEVVERPHGQSWNFLAHIIAAIGAFSISSNEASNNNLFAEVKSLMHVNYLEHGNLTLIRALTLIANYLQKNDMPNSGYNYTGLATRMAIGIGLHKEFPASRMPPHQTESRRRVWWCLTVFDVGADVTFGRPVLWPAGGFDVALPLNIHDWVSNPARASDLSSKSY